MLDRETACDADKRLTNRLAASQGCAFPTPASRTSTSPLIAVSTAAIRCRSRQGAWLKAHENLIITGQTGTGKTWLACAFGRQAARLDHSILYLRMPRLFEDLALARLDGRFPRLVDKLARVQLLILDDWGTHTPHRSTTPRSAGNLRGTLSP